MLRVLLSTESRSGPFYAFESSARKVLSGSSPDQQPCILEEPSGSVFDGVACDLLACESVFWKSESERRQPSSLSACQLMKRAGDSTSPASSGAFGVEAKHAVLDYYYDNVISLHSYLQACLPSELAHQLLDTVIDRASYTTLLQHAYVAYSTTDGHPKHLQDVPQDRLALEDVVRRVQREVLSGSGKADNILCHGYVMVGHCFGLNLAWAYFGAHNYAIIPERLFHR